MILDEQRRISLFRAAASALKNSASSASNPPHMESQLRTVPSVISDIPPLHMKISLSVSTDCWWISFKETAWTLPMVLAIAQYLLGIHTLVIGWNWLYKSFVKLLKCNGWNYYIQKKKKLKFVLLDPVSFELGWRTGNEGVSCRNFLD